MKYVVAEKNSIISKGFVYAPGVEITEKAFTSKEDFEKFVKKGLIIKAEEKTEKSEKSEISKETKGK